ncbi:MAG: hypothetical protein EOO70_01005, partial [Myxococcaceae bacterium]
MEQQQQQGSQGLGAGLAGGRFEHEDQRRRALALPPAPGLEAQRGRLTIALAQVLADRCAQKHSRLALRCHWTDTKLPGKGGRQRVGGEEGQQTLLSDPDALEFIADAYKHCKVIGAQGESFVFDNANLYAKWMDDIEQSQNEAGAIPDVAPAFWNYYSDDVTWPAAFITISNHLYNQYADVRPISRNYAAMRKWILYMKTRYLVNNIMTRDKYGDWCVPPENLQLIFAKDSSRLTDGKLIATAYYYKLLSYMQRFAKLTGNDKDIAGYGAMADDIRIAFQQKFY